LIRKRYDGHRRHSLYTYYDVERLKARSLARAGHGPMAANAMRWGEPVLGTAITEITARGPVYRGRLSLDFVRQNATFEDVAEYLWSSIMPAAGTRWQGRPTSTLAARADDIARLHPNVHIRQFLTEMALLLGIESAERNHDRKNDPLADARQLITGLTGTFGLLGPAKRYVSLRPGESIARGLSRVLGLQGIKVEHALNAALVIVADHEFTPATFAARIAASVGSDLHSCIVAALQVQFGSSLGLRCDLLEQYLGKVPPSARILSLAPVSRPLEHPLYTDGDPRAEALMEVIAQLSIFKRSTKEKAKTELDASGPSIDEALVALCDVLGTVRQVAGALLALGRTAGWIAHILEQQQENFIIRPRAKFMGHHQLSDIISH
jgi:citrate synthase